MENLFSGIIDAPAGDSLGPARNRPLVSPAFIVNTGGCPALAGRAEARHTCEFVEDPFT
ncbi:MAG: hypothetical protein GDA35_07475 [Hyphomonadaceae bacterium]|nr:hypothetical protein [Hyphomonadaceae bacterium]